MSEHTPGPWTASIGSRGARIHVANDANHPLSFGFGWSELDHALVREAQANARLIAAAPKMLDKLHEVRRYLEQAGECKTPAELDDWFTNNVDDSIEELTDVITEATSPAKP